LTPRHELSHLGLEVHIGGRFVGDGVGEPAPELGEGCCSYGAHFVSKEERVRAAEFAATLTPDEWQMAGA
jgi:hypothetical protein